MSKPCIVFDLDDTLYLERDYVRSGFNAVGRWADTALGLGDCAECAWRAFESGVRGTTFQVVLTQAGCKPDTTVIDEMVRVYRSHSPVISLPADSLHCLQELRKYAVLAVITDGPADSQQAKCRSLSLEDLVDTVICTGQWGPAYYKPNPHAFSYLQTQVGQSVSRFVYVADNPTKDFQAPVQLGWDVVRIKRPAGLYSDRPWLTDRWPYVELSDLWTLPDVLAERFSCRLGSAS
jgi:putative hydrolase of the HAD superfamily